MCRRRVCYNDLTVGLAKKSPEQHQEKTQGMSAIEEISDSESAGYSHFCCKIHVNRNKHNLTSLYPPLK